MIIEEKDFKLESSREGRFDLYFKNSSGQWKLYGYDIWLRHCLKTIIYHRLEEKVNTTDMKGFLKELKEMTNSVSQLLASIDE